MRYLVTYCVNAFPYIRVEAKDEQEASEKARQIPWSRWTLDVLDVDFSSADEAHTIKEEED